MKDAAKQALKNLNDDTLEKLTTFELLSFAYCLKVLKEQDDTNAQDQLKTFISNNKKAFIAINKRLQDLASYNDINTNCIFRLCVQSMCNALGGNIEINDNVYTYYRVINGIIKYYTKENSHYQASSIEAYLKIIGAITDQEIEETY
jgi:hypothetical protein